MLHIGVYDVAHWCLLQPATKTRSVPARHCQRFQDYLAGGIWYISAAYMSEAAAKAAQAVLRDHATPTAGNRCSAVVVS